MSTQFDLSNNQIKKAINQIAEAWRFEALKRGGPLLPDVARRGAAELARDIENAWETRMFEDLYKAALSVFAYSKYQPLTDAMRNLMFRAALSAKQRTNYRKQAVDVYVRDGASVAEAELFESIMLQLASNRNAVAFETVCTEIDELYQNCGRGQASYESLVHELLRKYHATSKAVLMRARNIDANRQNAGTVVAVVKLPRMPGVEYNAENLMWHLKDAVAKAIGELNNHATDGMIVEISITQHDATGATSITSTEEVAWYDEQQTLHPVLRLN